MTRSSLVIDLRYFASSRMDTEGRLMREAANEIERLERALTETKNKTRGW